MKLNWNVKKGVRRVFAVAKRHWKAALIGPGAVIVIVWQTFFGELTKELVSKWFSDSPDLVYSVLAVERLSRFDLAQYALREVGGAFNLQLDDTILHDYDIFKVRIQNKGGAFDNGFSIQAVINDGSAKLLDLKHVVRSPVNTEVAIDYSLPNLVWNTEAIDQELLFKWSSPTDPIIGSLLYRSAFKESGYGKFNFGLIELNCIAFSRKELLPGYYAVVSVGTTGLLSNLSPPLRVPDSLIFQAKFKDTVWIDPEFKSGKASTGCSLDRSPTYPSLTEAIAKEGTNRTFIVRTPRSGRIAGEDIRPINENVRVLREDELGFLAGRIELNFPEGLASRSEIDFYFLTKAPRDVKRNLRLTLRGTPRLNLTMGSNRYNDSAPPAGAALNTDKLSVTPTMISSYVTKKGILIMIPVRHTDEALRIFRDEVGSDKAITDLGKDIYDGAGVTGSLSCAMTNPVAKRGDGHNPVYESTAPAPPAEPPPRRSPNSKGNVQAPNAPTGFHITASESTGLETKENGMLKFFEDDRVRQNVRYKYTIYVYNKTVYSYPIQVFASFIDSLPALDCVLQQSAKQNSPTGSQPMRSSKPD